jgi:hypothetical protein
MVGQPIYVSLPTNVEVELGLWKWMLLFLSFCERSVSWVHNKLIENNQKKVKMCELVYNQNLRHSRATIGDLAELNSTVHCVFLGSAVSTWAQYYLCKQSTDLKPLHLSIISTLTILSLRMGDDCLKVCCVRRSHWWAVGTTAHLPVWL